jgi:tRNA modification GTPase
MEIHCHGNMLIVEKILADLRLRGCEFAEPGEFTKRAFLNGKLDLCQAEAVADVIHATNDRAIRVAQNQLGGEFSKKLDTLSNGLLEILAIVESIIDFADGDTVDGGEILPNIFRQIEKIIEKIEAFIASGGHRSALVDGIVTLIIGAPNAGKSSLFNLLLGENRAIVSEVRGTTRDIVSEKATVGGSVLKICDTAGLHGNKPDAIEKIGMEKAIEKAQRADFFLVVVDANAVNLPQFPCEILSRINGANALLVVNKIDLPKICDIDNFLPQLGRVKISATNLAHAKILRDAMEQTIAKNDELCQDMDVVANVRHVDALGRTSALLSSAKLKLLENHDLEIVAADIRQALEALGEITGGYDNEKMLDVIFSNFCIGK